MRRSLSWVPFALLLAACGGDYRPPVRTATGTAAPLGQVMDLEVSLPFLWIDGAAQRGVTLDIRMDLEGQGEGEHPAQLTFESAKLVNGPPVGVIDLSGGRTTVTVSSRGGWVTDVFGPLVVEETPFDLWLVGKLEAEGWRVSGEAYETQTGGPGSFQGWRRHRFLVAGSDFLAAGRVQQVDLVKETELRVRQNVESVSSDPVLRRSEDGVFVINRLSFDNVQRLDPQAGFATAWQSGTGQGSNPHDLVRIPGDLALVSRYEPPFSDLAVIRADDGTLESSVPLGFLAENRDGTPRPDRLVRVGGTVFVGLQDIDRTFTRYEEGKLAVVDAGSWTVQGAIRLGGKNPGSLQAVEGADGRPRLFVALAGIFPGLLPRELSGGVAVVDVDNRALERMALDDDDAGGNIGALAMASSSLGYVVVSDESFRNRVVAFDADAGTVLRTLWESDDQIPGLVVDGNRILGVPERGFGAPGLCLFRTPEDRMDDEEFLGCIGLELPPASLEAIDG
jgi:hypothetical protein